MARTKWQDWNGEGLIDEESITDEKIEEALEQVKDYQNYILKFRWLKKVKRR